jgi:hypothetical protein
MPIGKTGKQRQRGDGVIDARVENGSYIPGRPPPMRSFHDLRRGRDRGTIRSIVGAIALAKGDVKLCTLISRGGDAEIDEVLEQHDGWPVL